MKVEVFKHTARKAHTCLHCKDIIAKGEEINYAKLFLDFSRKPAVYKYCGTCIKLPQVKKTVDKLRLAAMK